MRPQSSRLAWLLQYGQIQRLKLVAVHTPQTAMLPPPRRTKQQTRAASSAGPRSQPASYQADLNWLDQPRQESSGHNRNSSARVLKRLPWAQIGVSLRLVDVPEHG